MKIDQRHELFKSPEIFLPTYDRIGKEAVRKVLLDYKGTKAVDSLSTFNPKDKGPVKGSNSYTPFLLANAYREITKRNIRSINPRESEIALAKGFLVKPTETYGDLGLAFYPKEGVNPVLWEDLREQVKSEFKDVDLGLPFVVTGLLNTEKNSKYEDGLRLLCNELTQVYNVPILTKKTGNFSSTDPELQRSGFPSELGQGDRTLYTAEDGVRGLCRGRGLGLGAWYGGLAFSNDTGRVHLVENFSDVSLDRYLDSVQEEVERERRSFEERTKKAIEFVKTGKI